MGATIELIEVRLDHPRGGTPLVEGANLAIARGEVVTIVGAAGVGTSRLVAAALGEVPPAGGRIDVFGRDVGKLRRSSLRLLRRRIGIVPQELCLLEDRDVQLNIVLPLEIDGIPRSISISRAADIMQKLGLEEIADVPVCELPPSIKQKVAVARALVREPELVLADHPTSMQDAEGADVICAALADASRNAAVLIFGREPSLLANAEVRAWRRLALADGQLVSLDHVEIEIPESIPNLVPFPISARTAGVA